VGSGVSPGVGRLLQSRGALSIIRALVRHLSLLSLVLGIALLPAAYGLAAREHAGHRAALERRLASEAQKDAGDLDAYFARARSIILLTANEPAFRHFDEQPGSRLRKVAAGGRNIADATVALRYLERLYPESIGEACFIDRAGREAARVVRGKVARIGELSSQEADAPFFAPTLALRHGEVFQARPYVSPDTREWVIANATITPSVDGAKRSIVHFEVTIESFRRAAQARRGDYQLRVIDARSGAVVIDADRPQRVGAPLGAPADHRFARLARGAERAGSLHVGGRPAAYQRIEHMPGNANRWLVVASATAASPALLGDLGPAPVVMLVLAVVLAGVGLVTLGAQRQALEAAAHADSLTGLGNRRRLLADLDRALARASDPRQLLLLFDLNGFKAYNDAFGHAAGDALLSRLGRALAAAVAPAGAAYRLGGDEFCVLADTPDSGALQAAALTALTERGDGFEISASFGAVWLPDEADEASEALRLADQRMYANKQGDRPSAGSQSKDVLVRALAERYPHLDQHSAGVAALADDVARHLGIDERGALQIRYAAELHDIGKVAIPDTILTKPGPLDGDERAFIRRHTLIGERILAAAPALAPIAKLVRASHERFDGHGYPDAIAGEEIPLGARIISVCDSFDAMITDRPYNPGRPVDAALAELRRHAGSQFDPRVVAAFCAVVRRRDREPLAA
jgi:diguanylate cyclase (GGDEF)-like protein